MKKESKEFRHTGRIKDTLFLLISKHLVREKGRFQRRKTTALLRDPQPPLKVTVTTSPAMFSKGEKNTE